MVNPIKYIKMQAMFESGAHINTEPDCSTPTPIQDKYVLFLDIDDCLYYSEGCLLAENKSHADLEVVLRKEYCTKDRPFKSLKELKREYGSSREGIYKYYNTSLDFVIQTDFNEIHKYVSRNDELVDVLQSMPFPIYCFGNAFPRKAEDTLACLEIEDYIRLIFCCNDNFTRDESWIAKPKPEAYRFIMKYLGIGKDTQVVFFDDKIENIATAISDEFKWISYHVTKENGIVERIRQFKEEFSIGISGSQKEAECNAKSTIPLVKCSE